MARKAASSPCVVCASPAYLDGRAPPAVPDDLAAWDCLVLARRSRVADEWSFTDNGEPCTVKVRGSLSSASGDVLHSWALAGFGISMEAEWDVAEDLASGKLVALLPGYRSAAIDLFATFAASRMVPPRIRLFVDYLAERLPLLPPVR